MVPFHKISRNRGGFSHEFGEMPRLVGGDSRIQTISLLISVIVTGIIIYSVWKDHKVFQETVVTKTEEQMLSTVKSTAIRIEEFLQHILRELRNKAEIPQIQDAMLKSQTIPAEKLDEGYFPLETIYEEFINADLFYVLDSQGTVLNRIPFKENRIGESLARRPGVEYVLKSRKPYISKMFKISDGTDSISIICPVFKDELFVGMLRVVFFIDTLNKNFLQPVKIGNKGALVLLDDEGTIYYAEDHKKIGEKIYILQTQLKEGDETREAVVVNKILSGSEGVAHFTFDEFSSEPSNFAWAYISTNPKASGTAGIKVRYDKDDSKHSLGKRTWLLAAELNSSIPRITDLVDAEKLDRILNEFIRKYPDIVEITIHGPRSLDDNTLIYKASTSPGLAGRTSDPEDVQAVNDNVYSTSYTKQKRGRPHAGIDVFDATVPIHTSDKLWSIVAIQPYSELTGPIDKDLKSTLIFSSLLMLMLFAGGIIQFITQKRKAILEVEREKLVIKARSVEELRERNEIISSISSAAHDAIIMADDENKITYWNEAAEKIFGYTKEEVIGKEAVDLIIPMRFMSRHKESFKKFVRTGLGNVVNKTVELSALRKSGEEFPIELSLSSVKIKNRWGALTIIRDITARKRAEEARKSDYLNLVGIMIVATDKNQIVTFINDAGCKILGYEKDDVVGSNWLEKFIPQSECEIAKKSYQEICAKEAGYIANFESVIINKDKKERTIIWNNTLLRDHAGNITGTLSAGEDITDKKKIASEREELWQQLLQSQKMESIGRLTGGLAHDFNNILTAIIGYSQLAISELKDDPVVRKIKVIRKSGNKAANLINHLLAFSRKQVLELKLDNLNVIIKDMGKMLFRVIGEDIHLELKIDSQVANCMIDETQIEQVLMNLVVNARRAMPDGGRLTVTTKDVCLDDAFIRRHTGAKKGKYVMLSVKDTGCGMTKEVKRKIFEPFFTTREKGEGTGLGLSTVFGIVKQHNGYIYVKSEPHKGTVFNIYLPRARGKLKKHGKEDIIVMKKGVETIMIVDDNDIICSLAQDILEPLGYRILTAYCAEAALEILSGKDDDQLPDLLLTDVIMPGMNGWELYQEVKKDIPDIKTIFCSGYLESPIVLNEIMEHGKHFISKPFNPQKLIKTVRNVLDGKEKVSREAALLDTGTQGKQRMLH